MESRGPSTVGFFPDMELIADGRFVSNSMTITEDAAYFRRQAARARNLAQRELSADLQREYAEIAVDFDKMAKELERQERGAPLPAD